MTTDLKSLQQADCIFVIQAIVGQVDVDQIYIVL